MHTLNFLFLSKTKKKNLILELAEACMNILLCANFIQSLPWVWLCHKYAFA